MTRSTDSMNSPDSVNSAAKGDDTPPEPPKYVTRESESPPLILGPRRLHYAYSVSLPLIHLTFVSIVQGFAVALLLQSFPLPGAPALASATNLISFVVAHYLYLPYFISGLVVVLIWKQFVQASMFIIWPLSTPQIALMLLISLVEAIAFREIMHFSAWLAGLGLVGLVGGFIRLNNLRIQSNSAFEFKELQDDKVQEVLNGILYVFLGLMLGTGGVMFHIWSSGSPIPLVSNVEWLVLGVVICIMVIVTALDNRDLIINIQHATLNSDLQADRFGGIEYIGDHDSHKHSG